MRPYSFSISCPSIAVYLGPLGGYQLSPPDSTGTARSSPLLDQFFCPLRRVSYKEYSCPSGASDSDSRGKVAKLAQIVLLYAYPRNVPRYDYEGTMALSSMTR
jgi:hypothetical protein